MASKLIASEDVDRSNSPAKPSNDAVEPTEAAANDDNTSVSSDFNSEKMDPNSLITETMIKEEQKLHEETLLEEEKIRDEAVKEWEKTLREQRFKALQHLLTRSNFYTEFLLQKMEQQRLEQQLLREKNEKKNKVKLPKTNLEINNKMVKEETTNLSRKRKTRTSNCIENTKKNEDNTELIPVKRGREKKTKQETFNLEDYIDEKTLKENQQNIVKNESAPFIPISNQQDVTDTFKRTFDGVKVSDRQPNLLTGGILRQYQIEGFEWLKVLYENGINGILADEMGLGKTIQCIALIAHLVEMGVPGPFLICAPLSTLPNWISEIQRFTPKLPTILYHGSIPERNSLKLKIGKKYPVEGLSIPVRPLVVTSYEIIMRDRRALQYYEWRYIIVDEGHRLKNLNCRLVRELKQYRSVNRLLLTGTPLQNNLSELWSLLNFLLPEIFGDLQNFESWFDFTAIGEEDGDERIVAKEQEESILTTLHQILTPFLLRRVKTDVELKIPPKTELLVYAPLTPKQEVFYKATMDRTIMNLVNKVDSPSSEVEIDIAGGRPKRTSTSRKIDYEIMLQNDDDKSLDEDAFNDYCSKVSNNAMDRSQISSCSTPKTSIVNIRLQNIMMQLRKCCNHPYLLEHPIDPGTGDYLVDENLVKSSGKLMLMDRMLPALRDKGHKILLFSQMTKLLDILCDYCDLRNYEYSRLDGSMKMETRQNEIKKFNEDPNVFLFLLSTRAGGLGINLIAADTVIIYDSDWNPQCDLQAQDRCHRIGQTKPVVVFRLVTEHTIDQRIVERAASKRKLEKMIIHHKKFKSGKKNVETSLSSLSSEELLALLKSSDHDRVVRHCGNEVISDEDLKSLLDRNSFTKQKCTSIDSSLKSEPTSHNRIFKVITEDLKV